MDLNARYELDRKDGEDISHEDEELKRCVKKAEPNSEHTSEQLGVDPAKAIRIGPDLPNEIKEKLTVCMKDNADLFAYSAVCIPGIPPEVAYYHLAKEPRTKWASKKGGVKIGKMPEATGRAGKTS